MNNHEVITAKFVEALEQFAAGERAAPPWVRPWVVSERAPRGVPTATRPHNGATGHVYQGVNVLLLAITPFVDPRWYTFGQACELTGWRKDGKRWVSEDEGAAFPIPKGTTGTQITAICSKGAKEDEEHDGDEKRRGYSFLTVHTVFNHEQLAWGAREPAPRWKPARADEAAALDENSAALVEALKATGAQVTNLGDRAYYMRDADRIVMPPAEAFAPGAYAATLAHETAHWTGHASRLGREFGARHGDAAYAVEELTAEFAAAFLASDFGLPGQLQHLEYLAAWTQVLKADARVLFQASGAARKAVDFSTAKVTDKTAAA